MYASGLYHIQDVVGLIFSKKNWRHKERWLVKSLTKNAYTKYQVQLY